jgi:hypothetical protein
VGLNFNFWQNNAKSEWNRTEWNVSVSTKEKKRTQLRLMKNARTAKETLPDSDSSCSTNGPSTSSLSLCLTFDATLSESSVGKRGGRWV